jgi:hypothetical protein
MSKEHDKQHPGREHTHSQPGYETTDVNINGILVFIASLAVFVVVFFVLCFGMGKLINEALLKADGPTTVWHQAPKEGGQLQNMASSSEQMQKQLQLMTQNFPTPRLEVDDGNQDLADLRAREDLLLEHYSWANPEHTKVRIPIDRAMEILVQSGKLAVAPSPSEAEVAKMTGVTPIEVTPPLTDGSAPTAYEIEMNRQREQELKLRNPESGQAQLEQPK